MAQDEQKAISIQLPYNKIKTFCRKWKITEFALFGSVVRNDFGTDSDIDAIGRYSPA